MGRLVRWFLPVPDPGIDFDTWLAFCDALAVTMMFAIVLTFIGIVLIYRSSAHRIKIRRAADLFRPYKPLLWLALSPISGIFILVWYYFSFQRSFPDSAAFWISGAGLSFVVATLLTVSLAYFATWSQWVTPVKFRYRPLPWFMRR